MFKKAFLFPGQGSQFVGMGKDLYNNFKEAKLVFEEVDDALSMNLSKIIFDGPDIELSMTENTQPAIMAVSIAHYLSRGLEPATQNEVIFAGHSLGEYSALVATKSLSLGDAARLLKIRGKAMQESCKSINSAMAAVLAMEIAEVREILDQLSEPQYICEVANHNSKEQIVISGHAEAVKKVVDYCKTIGKRAIMLKVSAPFHCSLIKDAEEYMQEAMAAVKISEPLYPVLSNVTADFYGSTDGIRDLLSKQVTSTVRWYEIMQLMVQNGILEVEEFGPGDVLKNLFKRHTS
jgi:[acyl-carrier-protein] S-malonyltransferase